CTGTASDKIYNTLRQSLSFVANIGKSSFLEHAAPFGVYTTEYGSGLRLEPGDLHRFESLTLGHRFDVQRIKSISSLRVSLTGNNLAVLTSYSGIDPELNVGGGNGFGSDGGMYPRLRSIAVGLHINFK